MENFEGTSGTLLLMDYVHNPKMMEDWYMFVKEGNYSFYTTYGAHGECSGGTYVVEGDKLILKDVNRGSNQTFHMKWVEEETLHFTGREMFKTTCYVEMDHDLQDIYIKDEHFTTPFQQSSPVRYYVNPVEIPWDVARERVRRLLKSIRDFLKLEVSEETLESLTRFNLDRKFEGVEFLIVDHDVTNARWIVYHWYGKKILMTLDEKTNTRTYMRYDHPDRPVEEREIWDELKEFHPLHADSERIKTGRVVRIWCKDLSFPADGVELQHLIDETLTEELRGIVVKDTVDERVVAYPNMWYVITDKHTNGSQVMNVWSKMKSTTTMEDIRKMRLPSTKAEDVHC
jgi:hypothetical protein